MEMMMSNVETGMDANFAATLADGTNNTVHQVIGEVVPRLGMMGEQLRQTSAQIEQAVVDVCQSFQDIATRATSSVTRSTQFLQNSGNEATKSKSFEQLVSTCDATMTRMMHAFTESGKLAEQAIKQIEHVDKKAREIGSSLNRIEEISQGNKILALNAQIEAARCGEYGAGFRVVAIELSSQTELSRKVTDAVGELVDSLRTMANSTMKDLQSMHDKTLERTSQCKAEVESTLQALREAHNAMQTMFHEVNDEGAMLAEDIGLAVRGMQFQDRVSQRIAHVVRDLEVMQQKLPGALSGQTFSDVEFSSLVMQEERAIYGVDGVEAAGGDIELF